MADPTQADLQTQLDEVNAQLAEMVGAASFSVAGFSIDESKLQDDLLKRKKSLEWSISNMGAGGAAGDNLRAVEFGGGY